VKLFVLSHVKRYDGLMVEDICAGGKLIGSGEDGIYDFTGAAGSVFRVFQLLKVGHTSSSNRMAWARGASYFAFCAAAMIASV
jgi:hypothetical protein